MDIKERFETASLVAAHYASFADFAADGMAFLGFPCTWMQTDIAIFMANGPRLRMIMAQRGEAKSTLAALYAVWRIIQRPSTLVLVVSAGEKQASEVAYLIIRLIMHWDILEYLRPDKMAGDRVSVEAFDVHHALKGLNKSPSVANVGITANLPGKRSDLLIADDVESPKNSQTSTSRAWLKQTTKEFSSICTHGDILWLGTPHHKDSVYNSLPGRGVMIRIWPGRFPTYEEAEKYGERLAPSIIERLRADPSLGGGAGLDGTRGKPTDPDRYTEDDLIEKELDKGPEDFQLQHMLDTSLVDAMRQQLKLSDLVVANFDMDMIPEVLAWNPSPATEAELSADFAVPGTRMFHPVVPPGVGFVPASDVFMYVDPAGGGSDEIGYGVSCAVGPYIHSLDVGGLRGGLTDDNAETLCQIIEEFGVKDIEVEKNMGHGLFESALQAEIDKRAHGYGEFKPRPKLKGVGIRGSYSTGQKERRIIDSLVSPMQRHRVILHRRVFESDIKYNKQHSIEKRTGYSLFSQLSNITTDRGSLTHDDRVEAFAGSIRRWKAVLAQDEHKAAEKRALSEAREYMQNPMGYDDPDFAKRNTTARGTRRIVHNRRGRR